MPQAKLSRMLRGQFRRISTAKIPDGLTPPGQDAQIVAGPARRAAPVERVAVMFA
ncbi:helix-turn-helix domain-containing protein [Verminephrobacter eiseniae]|uniref:helix-turn-helix domain-containing protein n=1 Tax=Verminephrobacter eiseniae TaxID=364317 RepID=UPI001E5948A2|nr:helix-turn-helix domain-containing protein [Verminephrobacter eiseniae]